jgi:hypothetical protein
MVSSEVQRTLVKSPPELWAELSDPAALARHLGELGEIRITRIEPEQKVEWEADDSSGTVLIDPSGWGTKVTLTATRAITEDESPPTPAAIAFAEPEAVAFAEPPAPVLAAPEPIVEAEPQPSPFVDDEAEPAIAFDEAPASGQAGTPGREQELQQEQELEPEGELQADRELEHDFIAQREPRRGFLTRLFHRRRWIAQPGVESAEVKRHQPHEPADAFAAVTRALAPETFAAAHPFAATHPSTPSTPDPVQIEEPPAQARTQPQAAEEPRAWAELDTATESDGAVEPQPDIAAEIRAAEELAAEEVTAVLTSVLDRLGAAHHRPFSRA